MRFHQREHTLVAAGLLLFGCLLLAFAAGCERNSPLGAATQEDDSTALTGAGIHEDSQDPALESFRWLCLWFPRFCGDGPGEDGQTQIQYWGGKEFDASRAEIPAWAHFHNLALTRWRLAERTPDGLLASLDQSLRECGLADRLSREDRDVCRSLFQRLLDGELEAGQLTTHEDVMRLWRSRPAKGPFARDERLESLLQELGDGIKTEEVQDWRRFAESKSRGDLREYWAASCMAASVAWWYDFGEETGLDMSHGVSADLGAIIAGGTWEMVAAASLAGALIDVIEHFWPKDEQ